MLRSPCNHEDKNTLFKHRRAHTCCPKIRAITGPYIQQLYGFTSRVNILFAAASFALWIFLTKNLCVESDAPDLHFYHLSLEMVTATMT